METVALSAVGFVVFFMLLYVVIKVKNTIKNGGMKHYVYETTTDEYGNTYEKVVEITK